MNIAPVVTRLHDRCPDFKLIGGAAEFERAQQGLTALPAAFAVPAEEGASDSPFGNQLVEQIVRSDFTVVVAVRNLADGTGAAAIDELELARVPVREALLGWQPTAEHYTCEYVDGKLLAFANGILWWADTYRTAYLIRSQ